MFGETALYLDERLVGLICDDRLFIKPTPKGRDLLADDVTEAPPYPGAKPCFLITDALLGDGARLTELVRITAGDLPPPKPKKRSSKALSSAAARRARKV